MKKLAFLALATLLSACSNVIPQSAPPVAGVFKGALPCADCEKIDAELILNSDYTYEYYTAYHKKGKEYLFTDKGTYHWDAQQRNVIRLANSGNLAVLVNDAHAEICGADGKPAKGKTHYRLQKVAQ